MRNSNPFLFCIQNNMQKKHKNLKKHFMVRKIPTLNQFSYENQKLQQPQSLLPHPARTPSSPPQTGGSGASRTWPGTQDTRTQEAAVRPRPGGSVGESDNTTLHQGAYTLPSLGGLPGSSQLGMGTTLGKSLQLWVGSVGRHYF